MSAPHPERTLDLRGLKCPLPVLHTRKALATLAPGQTLRVECTDPLAAIDLPHFAHEAGHDLLDKTERDGLLVVRIRKGDRVPAG